MGPEPTDADIGQVVSDLTILQDAGYDTSDAGRGNNVMTPATVAQETGCSSRSAAEARHDAHDDFAAAGDMGVPPNRHG